MPNLLATVGKVVKIAGGARTISAEIGISNPAILLNQLCATNPQHKLGAEDLERIIIACQPHSLKIVQLLASDIGCIVVQLPKNSRGNLNLIRQRMKAGAKNGHVDEVLSESMDPNSDGGADITPGERARIDNAVIEAIMEYSEMLSISGELSGHHTNRPKLNEMPAQSNNTILNNQEAL